MNPNHDPVAREPIHLHADDVLSDDEPQREQARDLLECARAFLRDFVGDRPTRTAEIYKKAEELGISERSLRRAKRVEHIESFKTDDCWWWQYPRPESPPEASCPP